MSEGEAMPEGEAIMHEDPVPEDEMASETTPVEHGKAATMEASMETSAVEPSMGTSAMEASTAAHGRGSGRSECCS
jgi:hypothetical protein